MSRVASLPAPQTFSRLFIQAGDDSLLVLSPAAKQHLAIGHHRRRERSRTHLTRPPHVLSRFESDRAGLRILRARHERVGQSLFVSYHVLVWRATPLRPIRRPSL